ncbi:MAG TPA: TlpA disulfide reductase family protein [Acidimicrobiales bacterium]|nr:TlpA disulfide reductase family protein [Acidimicrobiales bacterium]
MDATTDPSSATRTITLLDDAVTEVAVAVDGEQVVLAPADLAAVLGWELEPEGLCRGDVCVPVRDRSLVEPAGEGNGVSLHGVAAALDRPLVVDLDAGVAAIGPGRSSRRQALAGGPLPELALPDVDGQIVDLASLQGRKAILVAFATWCGCRDDLPGWQALQDDLGDDVAVVAVALDEDAEDVRPFAEPVTLPVLVDRDHVVSDRLGISNVPAVVWVDEDGCVARPPTVAFGTDKWTEYTGVPSGPHLDAVRRWVRDGQVPEGRANAAAGGSGTEVGDLSEDQEAARLWFRIATHLRRQGRDDEAAERFARAAELAPVDFTVARAAMPLTGRDPFGPDFFELYRRWREAGAPFHGLDPDR